MWVNPPKGVYTYTHTFIQGRARTLDFGPWYLDHVILIHGIGLRYLIRCIDPTYLVQGIGSKWF